MKITTMTRNTSVSGVMLISAKMPSPPSSASSAESGSFPRAILTSLHLGLDLGIRRLLLAALGRLGVDRRVEQELEELVGEELHLGRDPRRPLAEVVEQDDGRDGDADTGGGHDQRLRDRTGDIGEADLLAL